VSASSEIAFPIPGDGYTTHKDTVKVGGANNTGRGTPKLYVNGTSHSYESVGYGALNAMVPLRLGANTVTIVVGSACRSVTINRRVQTHADRAAAKRPAAPRTAAAESVARAKRNTRHLRPSPKTTSAQTATKATPATPSSTALSPSEILARGEQAVKAKSVSAPILTAAVKLGTAQAQQLGQPSAQYVATAAYIGYLEQLQGVCTDSPGQLANVVINAGDALRKTDHSVTYGQVMRVLYASAVGKQKHSCAAELAAATAATIAG
jgi:hypothetical protein